jgi:hypothetical protein
MGTRQTAEEIKKEHLQVLGPTLGPLFHELYNEVVWLHAKWLEYQKLYTHSAKRIDLLNNTAPFFFKVIQIVLWENVILHIARLTDPPQSPGKKELKKNLTLLRLPLVIREQTLQEEIKSLVDEATSKCRFTRDWRNRRYAHRDLDLALNRGVLALPKMNIQKVESVLEAFRAVLNRVKDHYFQSRVMFENYKALDDAEALLYHLRVATDAESRREKRLREGKSLPEDLEPPTEI